jgi:PucR C-terminal helix-turn-helix domain/GGDEF-like domain
MRSASDGRRKSNGHGDLDGAVLAGSKPAADGPDSRIARLARDLAERPDELAEVMTTVIGLVKDHSGPASLEWRNGRAEACVRSVRSTLIALTGPTEMDPTAATEIGVYRAHDHRPLASLIETDRLVFRRLREFIIAEGNLTAEHDRLAMRQLTVKLHVAEELFTNAMVAGYRDEQNRQLLGDTSHRAALIESLLHGQIHNRWAVWSAANNLRLPVRGPFVVIAAALPAIGATGLEKVESKLRSLDVYSAWQTLPDLQVGIVHVKSDRHLQRTLDLISRMATDQVRVGVSSRFDDLRDSAEALHFAKVTLPRRDDEVSRVAVFDGSMLATAAVSAPELMLKSARGVLKHFSNLPDDERAILNETFRVWMDANGSVRETAELLVCHPNTVRYRLRQIEKRTGKLLSRPRDLSELCLAFEVYRRLM